MTLINFNQSDIASYISGLLRGDDKHDIFCGASYGGGTLTVTSKDGFFLLLNLNNMITYSHFDKKIDFCMKMEPELKEAVRRCYRETKGETDYYRKKVAAHT